MDGTKTVNTTRDEINATDRAVADCATIAAIMCRMATVGISRGAVIEPASVDLLTERLDECADVARHGRQGSK